MKILAIGDFHGRFPSWIAKTIRKEKIDIVVSNGDYFPFIGRKLWFKHCYGTDKEFWEVIGKKRVKQITMNELSAGERVFKGLSSLNVPVITVLGNFEQGKAGGKYNDVYDIKKPRGKKYWDFDWTDFLTPLMNKYPRIKRFDYSYFRLGDYVFIGMNGHSFPGRVQSKAYKKHRKILDELFNRFKKENKDKKVVFVSHIVPYKTKLDKITSKEAHRKVKGKHYGSKLARRIIARYHPVLFIGGHIHEGKGKQKLGKTLCVNTGSAHEGQGAIIDLNGRVKVKFIK